MPHQRPVIIQGGMGVAVSCWQLARVVSQAGQLGVVSGTALDTVLARRLQDGDPDGDSRRALAHFPNQEVAERIIKRYFRPEGRAPGQPYRPVPKMQLNARRDCQELTVAGNFVEVWLAKEGHDGLVGINFLEKIQLATPASALGAMLAGVDYVLMGAGVPREIPRLLTDLAKGGRGGITIDVAGSSEVHRLEVDPQDLLGLPDEARKRPQFLAIIASTMLATYLARDELTRPDGYVIEGPDAGGHNAPPRGKPVFAENGEPVYGPRDVVDLEKVAAVGLPFWLAGGYATPEKVAEALAVGAAGVQIGSLFAFSNDSGLDDDLRTQIRSELTDGTLDVRTDAVASPTGFPFKVAQLPTTLSDPGVYEKRTRICDLSYLRTPYVDPKGGIGYRCASEPVHMYLKKGGLEEDTVGRKCLCNALCATVGLGQALDDGTTEPKLATMGSDLAASRALSQVYPNGWSAAEAIRWLTNA